MARPNFSGRWQFCADSSKLEIANPDSAIFTIEHDEPSFKLERTLVFDGKSDTFGLALKVGDGEGTIAQGCATLHPELHWEEDELVFTTRVVQGEHEAVNLVRYRLDEDGSTLVAEEKLRSPDQGYENRWVFKKE